MNVEKLNKTNHTIGRIALAIALLVIFAVPVTMMIVLQAAPNGELLGKALTNTAIIVFFLKS